VKNNEISFHVTLEDLEEQKEERTYMREHVDKNAEKSPSILVWLKN